MADDKVRLMEDIRYYRKLKYETRLWCISQQVTILAPVESFLAVTEEHTHVGTPLYYGYLCGNYSDYINEQLYCYAANDSFENDVEYTKEMVDDIRRHAPCLIYDRTGEKTHGLQPWDESPI